MGKAKTPGDEDGAVVPLRQRARCPICDGPTYAGADGADRCRNSLCVYNHRGVKCPRCNCQDLRSAWFASGAYHYSCARCQNAWDIPA